MNCTVCCKWFETTACPGPHYYGLPLPGTLPNSATDALIVMIEQIASERNALLAEVDALAARVEELQAGPYPENPGATHYDGCWKSRGHHNCAVARVRELEGFARAVYEWKHARPDVRHSYKASLHVLALEAEALLAGVSRATEPETGGGG